jgi:hypothetical protein
VLFQVENYGKGAWEKGKKGIRKARMEVRDEDMQEIILH